MNDKTKEYLAVAEGQTPMEKAESIYSALLDGMHWESVDLDPETKEAVAEIWNEMIDCAVRYYGFREQWNHITTAEMRQLDPTRTSAHNAFINKLSQVATIQKNIFKVDSGSWMNRMEGNRKIIGDLGCLIALCHTEDKI